MKNVIIFFLIILCLFINYKSKKNTNKLNNIIKQQDKRFNNLYLEKKIDDSICKKIWESLPLGPPLKFFQLEQGLLKWLITMEGMGNVLL